VRIVTWEGGKRELRNDTLRHWWTRQLSTASKSVQTTFGGAHWWDNKLNENLLYRIVNPLTPELNHCAQRCMTRNFIGDFAS
jgi:hypothetical protein